MRRKAEEALHDPYPGPDRFEPGFPVVIRCDECGKLGMAPREHVREAMREHRESDCPARRTKADEPNVARVFYPRS